MTAVLLCLIKKITGMYCGYEVAFYVLSLISSGAVTIFNNTDNSLTLLVTDNVTDNSHS